MLMLNYYSRSSTLTQKQTAQMYIREHTVTNATQLQRRWLVGRTEQVIETAIVPFEWSLHIDDCCWVCKGKSGRQKKGTKKRGRPKGESGKGSAHRVLRTAPPSWRAAQPLSLSRFLPPATSLSLHDLQCKLCECIVDRPVETLTK